MPKPFPIRIEVEEIALGTVLRRLNEMSGIVKIDLNLGHGGTKPLPHGNGSGGNGDITKLAIAVLLTGPKNTKEISEAIGGARSRAYGVVHQLKKKRWIKAGIGGRYQLTDKAFAELNGAAAITTPVAGPLAALPPPRQTKSGRAPQGRGNIVLRAALDAGPVAAGALRSHMTARGISTKSISGVLDRARRDGLIRKNGADLYELTAKGHKLALPVEAAHG